MRLRQKTIELAAVLVAGIVLFGPAPRAHAILVLEGTVTPSGGPAVTVYATDNNVAYPGGAPAGAVQILDTNGATGILSLAPGTIFPGYSVQSSTNLALQSAGFNDLNTSALQITNTTGGTVTTSINVGDNGFIGPASTAFASGSGTWNNAVGSKLNVAYYDDPTNTQPLAGPGFAPTGNLIASASKTVTQVSDAFSFASGPISVSDSGLYSMTLHFDFTLENGAAFVSRGEDLIKINAVPEPSTLVIVLGAVPFGLAYAWRRGRRPVV